MVEVEKRGNAIVCRLANKTESNKALIAKRPPSKKNKIQTQSCLEIGANN